MSEPTTTSAPTSPAAGTATPDPLLGGLATAHRIATKSSLWLTLGFFALLVPLGYAGGAIDITTVNQLGRYLCIALVALGLDLIWGYTGILSLCQMMFFTLGGYAIGMHLAMKGPLDGEGIPRALYVVSSQVSGMQLPWFWQPFDSAWLSVALVFVVPGVFAYLYGWLAFRSRVRGVYFSIITQATTLAATQVFRLNDMKLCGTNGLTNFVTIFGFPLTDNATKLGLYLASVVALTAGFLACRWLVTSRAGRVLIAIRDSESRLRFAGYQPVAYKTFAFVVAAILGAVGGMLYTPQNGIITPFKMNPEESIYIVAMVALGGRGTLSGAILGSLLFSFSYSWLSTVFADWWLIILGSLFVFVILAMPDGLVGAWRRLGVWLTAKAHPQPAVVATSVVKEPTP
jgi:urea transport system permease protein